MEKRLSLLATFVALVLLATPAAAESLRIITVSLAPYGYLEHGRIVGLSHEVGMAIAQETGYEPSEILGSLSRGVHDLSTGEGDILIMIPTSEVEGVGINLGPMASVEIVAMGRVRQPLRSVEDVRGKTVAVVRKARYDERMSKANGMNEFPVDDYAYSLKMLMAQRVDFVLGPRLGLFSAARQLKLPRKAFGKPLMLATMQACLFVSPHASLEKIEKIKQARNRLLENGAIQQILDKYYL